MLGFILGGIFLGSALPKLRRPEAFVMAVLEYQVLPPALGELYGWAIPPLELLLAALLISGTAVRMAAAVAALLLLSFIVAVGINVVRGRTLDCHCFGAGARRPVGWYLLAEDGALVGMALGLIALAHDWMGLAPWSVFRLTGPAQADSIVPLLGCVGATACLVALLRRTPVEHVPSMALHAGRSARRDVPHLSPHLARLMRNAARGATDPLARARSGGPSAATVSLVDDEGPPIGSQLPEFTVRSLNGFGVLSRAAALGSGDVLLLFLSPLCTGCQRLVEPVNALMAASRSSGRIIGVLQADERTCRMFLSVFPLRIAVICDGDRAIAGAMQPTVQHTPFGLLYDAAGVLKKKGIIERPEDVCELLEVKPAHLAT